jgi:3',5'-cyclic AMP phosphodiesterase CpdA
LKWSDLHFGAYIRDLIKTPDYDSDILLDGLLESVNDANMLKFNKTHVHINGDLIESFSGLNHINSWMSLDKNQVGANSIMLCCDLLEKALVNIDNLGSIKIVAGNHDRLSKDNKEDVKGGAAELIAWGLKLKGFDVEFNSMVISHKVNEINHINLHGHLGISKQSTEYIILNYGIQGMYNLICEGHLHSIIEKLSAKQRSVFKMVSDDSIDYRRMNLQSFFTGNYYSETLGYTTNAGYSIFWDNGNGKPKHLNVTR